MNLLSGVSGNAAEGLTSSLAQMRINGVDREMPLQCIKMLDENLHWSDAALDVCNMLNNVIVNNTLIINNNCLLFC